MNFYRLDKALDILYRSPENKRTGRTILVNMNPPMVGRDVRSILSTLEKDGYVNLSEVDNSDVDGLDVQITMEHLFQEHEYPYMSQRINPNIVNEILLDVAWNVYNTLNINDAQKRHNIGYSYTLKVYRFIKEELSAYVDYGKFGYGEYLKTKTNQLEGLVDFLEKGGFRDDIVNALMNPVAEVNAIYVSDHSQTINVSGSRNTVQSSRDESRNVPIINARTNIQIERSNTRKGLFSIVLEHPIISSLIASGIILILSIVAHLHGLL